MHIDSKDKLAGMHVMEVRKLFRSVGLSEFAGEFASDILKITDDQANHVLRALCAIGYIESGAIDRVLQDYDARQLVSERISSQTHW